MSIQTFGRVKFSLVSGADFVLETLRTSHIGSRMGKIYEGVNEQTAYTTLRQQTGINANANDLRGDKSQPKANQQTEVPGPNEIDLRTIFPVTLVLGIHRDFRNRHSINELSKPIWHIPQAIVQQQT